MLKGRESDGALLNLEDFVRTSIRDFRYRDSQLLSSLVKGISKVKLVRRLTVATEGKSTFHSLFCREILHQLCFVWNKQLTAVESKISHVFNEQCNTHTHTYVLTTSFKLACLSGPYRTSLMLSGEHANVDATGPSRERLQWTGSARSIRVSWFGTAWSHGIVSSKLD